MKRSLFGIFFGVLISFQLWAANDIKIINSSAAGLHILYTPAISDSSIISINGTSYYKFVVSGCGNYYRKPGSPQIPSYKISIGVPQAEGNFVSIIRTVKREISGKLIPVPSYADAFSGGSKPVYDEGAEYSKSGELPGSIASLGNPGIIRGLNVIVLTINPVQFNPVSNQIELITSIELEVRFPSVLAGNTKPADPFMRGMLINYDVAKNWAVVNKTLNKAVKSSVLATGKWFRFTAAEEGIYKITRDKMVSLGFDASTMDPRTIKIYNNGGKIVPERVLAARAEDLLENAIYIDGEADGKLDDNDYILFYGRGPNFWQYESNYGTIVRSKTPYSNDNYYWITWDDKPISSGGTAGKRMSIQDGGFKSAAADSIATTLAFFYREDEKINIGKTGRQFLGDDFSSTVKQRTYTNILEGYVGTQPVTYKYRFVNASTSAVDLYVAVNQNTMLYSLLYGFSRFDHLYGRDDERTFTFTGPFTGNRSDLRFTYDAPNSGVFGYLDYYELSYLRDLKAYNGSITFYAPASFSSASNKTVQYNLSEFGSSDIRVFNVSDFANARIISNPVSKGVSTYSFQITEPAAKYSKYIALIPGSYKTPGSFTAVANQDIRGFSAGVKHVIITASKFKDQATRLMNYRASQAKQPLSSKVFVVDDVYNEFGCGQKDPTAIRDFIRYAYLNWAVRPEYVLLFGDGDYDYKDIEQYGNNYIPAYELEESLNEIDSYCLEDYFASVDGDDYYPDVALGRLPVQSASEASIAVDKIIHYENSSDKSQWRNRVSLVSDDGFTSSGEDGEIYTADNESISKEFPPNVELNKIYLADFPAVKTSWGRRKPDANKAIINAINEGTLLINYIGHGSPEVWAYQEVFNKDVSIPSLNNSNYCFLTTGTCSFGYFDKTLGHSGAEMMVLAENKAAIGSLSTVRPVYAPENESLLRRFYNLLFYSVPDSLNQIPRIGQIYMFTKQVNDDNDQKFNLLGDPAIRLVYPQYTGIVDSLNGALLNSLVQIKALSKVRICGKILKDDTTSYSDYSGSALISVYDSGIERTLTYYRSGYKVLMQGGLIFRGQVDVKNGRFETEFVVPKDIAYSNNLGRIVIYFYNSQNDGLAFSNDITVGGTDTTQVNDGKGPEVSISFGSASQSGDFVVKQDESLLVKLTDETGINTTGSGIGHKLQAVLNEDESNILDLSNYFTADFGSAGKSGKVEYKLSNVPTGDYKIEVRAFDVFNNKGVGISKFKVVSNDDKYLSKVYNFPNPFSSNTTFIIDHTVADNVSVKLKIFSVAGRLIKEVVMNNVTASHVLIPWNGNDNDGNQIANGVYIYKVIIKPEAGGESKTCLGKLSIVR